VNSRAMGVEWTSGAYTFFTCQDSGSGCVAADMTPASGSYTATITGCTTAPTETVTYYKIGKLVNVWGAALTCTSNAITMTLTGAPAAITPASGASCAGQAAVGRLEDNGAFVTDGMACMNQLGVINFGRASLANFNAFTASGAKGIGGGGIAATFGWSFSYQLQ
jgi:hypothetical protein